VIVFSGGVAENTTHSPPATPPSFTAKFYVSKIRDAMAIPGLRCQLGLISSKSVLLTTKSGKLI